jgi:hypothetical protein
MDGITRADILDWDADTLRDTAACYGLDVSDLSDDDAFAAFAEFLDDLEALVS